MYIMYKYLMCINNICKLMIITSDPEASLEVINSVSFVILV